MFAGLALLVAACGAAGGVPATTPAPATAAPVRLPASPAPAPKATPGHTGVVSVTVSGLTGASGSTLAAILYVGVPALRHGTGQGGPLGLGGFAAAVDAAPFGMTGTLRQGSPLSGSPSGARPVATIPVGLHTLVLWVSSDLEPDGEWMPADPIERACMVTIPVTEGRTSVRVTGIPAFPPADLRTPAPPAGYVEVAPCQLERLPVPSLRPAPGRIL
jgi:hypothetical protein